MILEIDYGNTRLKWRLLATSTSECVAKGAVVGLQDLLLALEQAGCLQLVLCRACSVRSADENMRLNILIKTSYGVEIQYAQSLKEVAGVVNGYLEANKLGVDRWLVILAAYAKVKHACIVIDCGTAITVDYVTANGLHMGGCIAPGIKMLRTMLRHGTQISTDIVSRIDYERVSLGDNTQSAVDAGVDAMFRGFIHEQIKTAHVLLGSSFSVLCTGGDGELVYNVMSNAVYDEDLVFSGLAVACPYIAKE